jgi:hypothetical protein
MVKMVGLDMKRLQVTLPISANGLTLSFMISYGGWDRPNKLNVTDETKRLARWL